VGEEDRVAEVLLGSHGVFIVHVGVVALVDEQARVRGLGVPRPQVRCPGPAPARTHKGPATNPAPGPGAGSSDRAGSTRSAAVWPPPASAQRPGPALSHRRTDLARRARGSSGLAGNRFAGQQRDDADRGERHGGGEPACVRNPRRTPLISMSSCEFLSSDRWASGSPSNVVAPRTPSQGDKASTARADCMQHSARTQRKLPPGGAASAPPSRP